VGDKLLERFESCSECDHYEQLEGPHFEVGVDDGKYEVAPDAE
jgi:hypothetical protein